MGIYVDVETCNRCGTAEEPMCVRDCPGDLMYIADNGKAAITTNQDCWDCAACVKVCPTQAITMRLPVSLVAGGAMLRGRAYSYKTTWKIALRDGTERDYVTPSTGKPPFTPSL